MKKRLRKGSDSAEVNMTPMLDIVFILLIFFIVTSTFLQERGLQMIAPPSDEEQDENPQIAESIFVQVDRNSRVFVNGRLTDTARVTAAIQRQNVDNGGNSAVVIQPDPDSEHGVVTKVYDSALVAGLTAVIREPQRTE